VSSLNKHILIGYVGKDPEIRYTSGGDPIANFSLATSESWKDKATGEKHEKTEWHQITCFGSLATVAENYITKGKQLYVEGPSSTEEWIDRGGAKRTTVKIKARQIVLLGGGGEKPERDVSRAPEPVAAGRREEGSSGDDDEIPF
jgi:single-strand DNA-binding protein